MDCSICLDCIDTTKNSVTTECGHCFHASCLMTNVAHNGFGCPYCRTEMAEVPEDSDDEDDDSEYYEEYEEDLLDDYSLRGFRWLFQRAEGEELDDEPDDEFEDDESDYEEDLAQPPPVRSNNPNVAPWNFVSHHLLQRGVTPEMLVRALLSTSHREYRNNRECDVSRNAVLGGMQLIIDGFRPYQLETLERDIQQEQDKKEFEIERRVRLRLRALGHNVDDLDSEIDSEIVR